MSHSDHPATNQPDWRAWIALAWMVGFGLLYVGMILREKAPGLLARLTAGG